MRPSDSGRQLLVTPQTFAFRARRYVVGGSSTLVGGGTGLRTLLEGDLRLRRMGLRDRILPILIPESTKATLRRPSLSRKAAYEAELQAGHRTARRAARKVAIGFAFGARPDLAESAAKHSQREAGHNPCFALSSPCARPRQCPPTAEGASPAMAQWFALRPHNPDAALFPHGRLLRNVLRRRRVRRRRPRHRADQPWRARRRADRDVRRAGPRR